MTYEDSLWNQYETGWTTGLEARTKCTEHGIEGAGRTEAHDRRMLGHIQKGETHFGCTDYDRTTRAGISGGQMESYEGIRILEQDTEKSHELQGDAGRRYGRYLTALLE